MAAHTTAQFNLFMSQLRETNATLDFYCDFPKIARNVADIEISLNTLNYLIGKENLREAVEALWDRDKRVFDVMDILIATRKKDDKKYIDYDGSMYSIHSLFTSVDGVMKFIEGTGLDKVFTNKEHLSQPYGPLHCKLLHRKQPHKEACDRLHKDMV